MPDKHPNTERLGGPGASHENRQQPEKSQPRGPHPAAKHSSAHAGVSGGGGEPDIHHTHLPPSRGPAKSPQTRRHGEGPSSGAQATHQESDHNKHNHPTQPGHRPQKHGPAEQKH
jgi:hypothetical protein